MIIHFIIFFSIIIIFIIYLIYKTNYNESYKMLSFALINTQNCNYDDIINQFQFIDLISIMYKHNKRSFTVDTNKFNYESLPISYKSINNYITFISPRGDAIYLKKYHKDIILNLTHEFKYIFLLEENHISYVIIVQYLYKNENAIYVQYISRRKDKESFNDLIGFINYIKLFIEKYNIKYYAITGMTKLESAKWNKILKYKFKNVYISPTYIDNFISCIDEKMGIGTPDFILISSSLAPYGVYYYVTDIFSYNLSKFALIAEIYNNNKFKKSKFDKTIDIYNYVKNNNFNFQKELLTEKDVYLEEYNLDHINVYHEFNKKSNT